MARPLKSGLDYWPMDVGFFRDKKIRLIKGEFGVKGIYIVLMLLNRIYEENGYYLPWDNDECLLMSEGVDGVCDHKFVGEVVQGCLRRSLFDEGVFQVFRVLTSAGIQRRYISAIGNNRNSIRIAQEYWLLDLNNRDDISPANASKIAFYSVIPEGTKVNPSKTTVFPTDNPQSKVEESIGKKTKGKESAQGATTPPAPQEQQEDKPIFTILTNTGTPFPVYQNQIDTWKELYPAVNVEQEIRNMIGWNIANPDRRKTERGMMRFINNWLAKSQNCGGSSGMFQYSQNVPAAISRNGQKSTSEKLDQYYQSAADWAASKEDGNG